MLRRTQARAADFQRLAKQLGRRPVKRGKEPTWESDEFPSLFVLTIPYHGGKDLAPGTKRSILNQLEQDVFAWEIRLDEEDNQNEDGDGHDDGNGSG